MAVKRYLVPVDFSKSSDAALSYGGRLLKENKQASLILVHVITESAAKVPFYMREKYYEELKEEARKKIRRLLNKKHLRALKSRVVIVTSSDPARAIANQAKKSKASMIIMGSRGRTGLKRLVLGSVAERTLRYASCPVLIVKR
ncbi:MAG TPA: universal stress protein [Candidatus Binatia bacterium]|nr:universal stress protein [Candidatus Binatia bacterium]